MIVRTATVRYGGPDRLDVTVKGNDPFGKNFAPPGELLRAYLRLRMQQPGKVLPEKDWLTYAKAYKEALRERYRQNPLVFRELLQWPEVTLVCYCHHPVQCHRHVLAAEVLARFPRVMVLGERPRNEGGTPHEDDTQTGLFSEEDTAG